MGDTLWKGDIPCMKLFYRLSPVITIIHGTVSRKGLSPIQYALIIIAYYISISEKVGRGVKSNFVGKGGMEGLYRRLLVLARRELTIADRQFN